ncbi:MAG: hypothetical protein M1833_003568 [Piccolia ochrophora]|nr:MAG: hypothetical protein M1833_003568 [Piccolia ochrophora]
MAPYPDKSRIRSIFSALETGQFGAMFEHVADDVDWTVMGHHPLAGRYTSKQSFQEGTLSRLGKVMKEDDPIKLTVRNVIGGDDEEWAVVELIAKGTAKNGLPFDNTYAWVTRWNTDERIVQVRAYLDSELVKEAIEQNE